MLGILIILAVTVVIVVCTLVIARVGRPGENPSEQYLQSPTWNGSMAGGPTRTDLTAPAVVRDAAAEHAEDAAPAAAAAPAGPPEGARFRRPFTADDFTGDDQLVDDVVRGLQRIPPLPHVLLRILGELNNASSSARSLAGIVATEPVLTASLLRVANSAATGLRTKIITVDEAVAYLGYATVRALVLRMKLAELLPQRAGSKGYNSEHLWLHSLVVGQVAAHLAKRVQGVDVALVSTIGLLHDIGKLAINSQFPETVAKLFERDGRGPADESFLARERRLFGADHAFAGAFLATQWKLPVELIEAIRFHHVPGEVASQTMSADLRRATLVVHVANQLAKYAHVYCADMEIDIIPEHVLASLGLPTDIEHLLKGDLRQVIARAAIASTASTAAA
jgi:putative nucleotidyltransferase with HDIG domain